MAKAVAPKKKDEVADVEQRDVAGADTVRASVADPVASEPAPAPALAVTDHSDDDDGDVGDGKDKGTESSGAGVSAREVQPVAPAPAPQTFQIGLSKNPPLAAMNRAATVNRRAREDQNYIAAHRMLSRAFKRGKVVV